MMQMRFYLTPKFIYPLPSKKSNENHAWLIYKINTQIIKVISSTTFKDKVQHKLNLNTSQLQEFNLLEELIELCIKLPKTFDKLLCLSILKENRNEIFSIDEQLGKKVDQFIEKITP